MKRAGPPGKQPQPEHEHSRPEDANLAAMEELFRATFEQAAVGMAHVGLDGRFMRVNQRLCDIVDYSSEELIAKTFQEITYAEDLDTDLDYVRQMLTGEIETYSMEKRYIRKDGLVTWINLTVSLVRTPSGEPKFFISVMDDINKRKWMEIELGLQRDNVRALETSADHLEKAVVERTAELLRTKEHIEAILNAVGEAIVVMGKDGRIRQVNSAFEAQTGYAAQEIELADHKKVLLVGDSAPEMSRFLHSADAMRRGESWQGVMPVRRRDGSTYEAAVSISPLYNEANEITSFVGALRDISPLKEVERLKDSFVANVSHELRTPITGIKLSYELLKRDPDQSAVYMERLAREIERLNILIEDLLSLSRIDQGRMLFNLIEADLHEIATEYVADRKPLAEARGQTLSFERHEIAPTVRADHSLLGQALSVLLTNAITYTQPDGTIMVRTVTRSVDGQQWAGLLVQDNGPGILPEDQAHLWERFFRGRAGRESNNPGTGLGLAIAREIMDRHGGEIEVQSTGVVGEGTAFTLWLPAAE